MHLLHSVHTWNIKIDVAVAQLVELVTSKSWVDGSIPGCSIFENETSAFKPIICALLFKNNY